MLNEELRSGDFFKRTLPFSNCKLNTFSWSPRPAPPKRIHDYGAFIKNNVICCRFLVAKWQWKWSCKPPRYWRLFSKAPRHLSSSNHQKWIRKVSTCCPQTRKFWVTTDGLRWTWNPWWEISLHLISVYLISVHSWAGVLGGTFFCLEKYVRVKLRIISPRFRGENSTNLWNHPSRSFPTNNLQVSRRP